ncbi:MAG: DUF2281 domain-containing protein [Methanosarcinaceae archaeon]|nr:DUF2281 domain-containing protein [Methanosarcinaceae archaeon]
MQELPEYLRREVLDYIDFLSIKYKSKLRKENKFEFDWEGGFLELLCASYKGCPVIQNSKKRKMN